MTKKQTIILLKGILFSMFSFFLMYGITYILLSEATINQSVETYKAIKGMSLISGTLFMLFATFMFWHTEWKNKKYNDIQKKN